MTSRTHEHSAEQRLARPVLAALLLLCIWMLVRLAATLLGALAPEPSGQVAVLPPSLAAPDESVAGWHVFGSALAPVDPRSQVDLAPETDQAIVLHGVVAESDPALGVAFVAEAGAEQAAYRVGTQLPGGSRLLGVFPDRILLQRGGKEESLLLQAPEQAAAPGAAAAAGTAIAPGFAMAPIAPQLGANVDMNWQAVQRQMQEDPAALAQQVRVLPVLENGAVVGMRLSGGAASALVARAGLLPDDIVTAVNGISVRDVGRAQQIMASVRSADRVSVTVRRDGKEQTINVDLRQR
jgi:general secretion pathway protein C